MRKVFLIASLFTVCFFGANAQNFLNVKMSKGAVNAGDSVSIDVSVTNFTLLVGAQFSINWDSTKFKFGKIENKINSAILPGDLDIGFPPTTKIKNGQVTFSWNTINSASIPNDTRLFTIKLKAIGAECDSTTLVLSDKPLKAEYYDENLNTFKPTSSPGLAKINGAACMGGGGGGTGDELTVKAPILDVKPGSEVCIPITVTNFIDIEGAQSIIKWDPAVLKIKPLPPLKFDALKNNTYNNQSGIGELKFVWFTGSGPVNIPNGDRLMEICFDVIGPVGSMTTIDIVDKDVAANFETEYTNSASDPVPFINIDGKVTVVEMIPETLTLSIANVNALPGDSVDVTFTVDKFIDIKAVQFAITYDPNVLQFGRRYMDADLAGAGGTLASAGRYNYSYLVQGTSTKTLPDGSVLFKLKFKVVACPSGATTPLFSAVSVTDLPGYQIEFIDKNTVKVPYTIKQGSVTAPCDIINPPTCKIVSSTNVSCKDKANGTINVEVTNASGCQCQWKKDNVNFGNPISTPNCNLANIGPGVYTLEITCGGEVKCTSSVTITEAAGIDINAEITNVSCNTLGSIKLNVTGGTGNITYNWSIPNTTTKDISNLTANSYTVTVTDAAICTSSKSFTVIQLPTEDLKVVPQVVNVKCFGFSTGSIKLNPTGGCEPYAFAWAGDPTNNTDTRINLAAGTYGVTVTDASTPAKSVPLQINVAAPTTDISIAGTVINSTGSDGAVDVTVSGGTIPYSYKWSDGITTEDRTGLAPGIITLEVTDANGCKKTSSNFEVVKITNPPNPSMGDIKVTSEALNAGYGVSCVNICDGVIAGNANGGAAPYTIVLSGQSSKTITLASAGPFSFKELCAGTYSVKLTDFKNVSTPSSSFTITQPTAMSITKEVKCAEGQLPTGSITINVTGGAGDYKYKWSNNKETSQIDNLQVGSFAVVVSDANGCQVTSTNIRVNDCTNNGENCYEEFTNIITPNSDGANDYFLISCAPNIDNELFIYDRWGSLVYSQKNYDNLWNGLNLSGAELPENAYMWVLIVKNSDSSKDTFKGAVTILRGQ